MTPQIYFAATYVPFVVLQGMSVVTRGKTEKILRNVSYLFALAAIFSYAMFIEKVF
jgi:hypothetical protein